MKEEGEFVKIKTLCEMFDSDRRTMERLLSLLKESYSIEVLDWNGQKRVNIKQFRRAVLEQSVLSF